MCSPLVAYDGTPLLFSLSGVKKLLKMDGEKCSVSKVVDMDAFWDLLVGEVADVWSGVDVSGFRVLKATSQSLTSFYRCRRVWKHTTRAIVLYTMASDKMGSTREHSTGRLGLYRPSVISVV